MKRQTLGIGVAIIAGAVLFAGAARAEDGKAVYDKNCVSCHGAGGKGDGPAAKAMKPPPQDFATALKSKTDADVAKVLTEGAFEGKKHPVFAKKLSEDQIKAVAKYAKEFAK